MDRVANSRVARLIQRDVSAASAQGAASPTALSRFPHAARIESALGRAVPGCAVLDDAACQARNVEAFTSGQTSHFRSDAPDLHVAAHEATHLLQHDGATRDGGLGAELHAHAVATAIADGAPTKGLLTSSGAAVPPAERGYYDLSAEEQEKTQCWRHGKDLRISDSERLAIQTRSKVCYASGDVLRSAQEILGAKRSGLELTMGSGILKKGGEGARTLFEVVPTIPNSFKDCGRFSREVQGPSGFDRPASAVFKDREGREVETKGRRAAMDLRNDFLFAMYGDANWAAARSASESQTSEDRARALTKHTSQAQKSYFESSESDAFDRARGINRYAEPAVGESFVHKNRDLGKGKDLALGDNFHWAAVVLIDGSDRVTLESGAPVANDDTYDDWYFGMYGSPRKDKQTFYDAQPTRMHFVFVARTQGNPARALEETQALKLPELVERYNALHTLESFSLFDMNSSLEQVRSDEIASGALIAQMRKRWAYVHVTVLEQQDLTGSDDVKVVLRAGARAVESTSVALAKNEGTGFLLPLKNLAPITGPITVDVYEEDWAGNDHIVSLKWRYPYAEAVNTSSMCKANYKVVATIDQSSEPK